MNYDDLKQNIQNLIQTMQEKISEHSRLKEEKLNYSYIKYSKPYKEESAILEIVKHLKKLNRSHLI